MFLSPVFLQRRRRLLSKGSARRAPPQESGPHSNCRPAPTTDLHSAPMGRVLAVANQKGGVAKTTTTHSLGAGLAELGERVLLVDLDPQACLTYSLGIDSDSLDRS